MGPGGKEPAKKWPYRGDIDGLRAVAVVAVVLFHFGVNFRGGFTGVDVFFVISGYLITSIQLGRLQKGTFSMREFWARRVRRLFWACAVMLAVVVVAAHYVFLSADFQSLLSQMTAVQLFGANFHYYLEQPYFFDHLEAPLLHCWSLAAEEQYYMLYPFLLRGMWWCTGGGDRGRHALLSSLVVIFIASLALSIAWSGKTDSRGNYAFYLLPAQAWEMALGGLLVPLDHRRMDHTTHARRLAKAVLSWVGVGMIVASFWLFSAATP
jgi:peptidoglycan/LPS O-acetylase OafA/YrhL